MRRWYLGGMLVIVFLLTITSHTASSFAIRKRFQLSPMAGAAGYLPSRLRGSPIRDSYSGPPSGQTLDKMFDMCTSTYFDSSQGEMSGYAEWERKEYCMELLDMLNRRAQLVFGAQGGISPFRK